MASKLSTVEDTFYIEGRGLVVVPGVPIERFPKPTDLDVELRFPDGRIERAVLSLVHEFIAPPPDEFRYACTFREKSKADIPKNTEIWVIDDHERE